MNTNVNLTNWIKPAYPQATLSDINSCVTACERHFPEVKGFSFEDWIEEITASGACSEIFNDILGE